MANLVKQGNPLTINIWKEMATAAIARTASKP
jgi:hypothetical protein